MKKPNKLKPCLAARLGFHGGYAELSRNGADLGFRIKMVLDYVARSADREECCLREMKIVERLLTRREGSGG